MLLLPASAALELPARAVRPTSQQTEQRWCRVVQMLWKEQTFLLLGGQHLPREKEHVSKQELETFFGKRHKKASDESDAKGR